MLDGYLERHTVEIYIILYINIAKILQIQLTGKLTSARN